MGGNKVELFGQVHPDSRPGSQDGVLLSLWLSLQGELIDELVSAQCRWCTCSRLHFNLC